MAGDAELRVHRDWIGALQPVGLVVSAPALVAAQAFPDQNTLEKRAALLALVKPRRPDETDKEHGKRKPLPVRFAALAEAVLGWKPGKLVEPPEGLSVVLPAFHETLRPTWAVRALPEDEGEWMMLVQELPDGAALDEPPAETGKKWHASPQVRLERLLKETGVPIGILTNGFALRLVHAPRAESSGHVTWPLPLMTQASHKEGLAALCMLLGTARLFALGREQRLPHILKESRKYQNVVSTKLAGQVLEALNELLRGFQAANEKAKGRLLDETVRHQPDHLYGGLLAVLLRLVFVLYAEERGMLSSSAIYVRNYSLVGLFEKLRVDHGRFPDTMDDRYGAWSRLLVLFRMIYDGAKRDDLRLPARYGHLFEPNAWAFLEGRPHGVGRAKDEPVDVPKVADGVVYRVLEKLLQLDGERLSYRALDVEQIGSVYENMMGFRVKSAAETSIGVGKDHVVVGLDTLLGKKGSEREKYLKEAAGVELSGKAAEALRQAGSMDDLVASLSPRISPLTPRTIPAGGIYLQPTEERRRSGSHYTPRALTKPMVETTLRPVLEALGETPTPESLMALKVCDPAMGSGAFLVEACRQLGLALVVAWQQHGRIPEIPPDEDQELHARRLVAQKCIYGVDKNEFAVELAKLSIWLVTLAKEHPLTFLDHALKEGDSLVGLSAEQIYNLAFDVAKGSKMMPQARNTLFNKVRQAEILRGQLHDLGDSDNTAEKRRLLEDADDALDDVKLIGDGMVASFFAHGSDKDRKKALENLVAKMPAWVQKRTFDSELRGTAAELGSGDKPVKPFHWEIEFPEVFSRERPGFDCMMGNPPFLGGSRLSTALREHYEPWLKARWPDLVGKIDLVVFFFHRAAALIRPAGTAALVATYRIADGANAVIGLRPLTVDPWLIYWAHRERSWPGVAATRISQIAFRKHPFRAPIFLDGRVVDHIGCDLRASTDLSAAVDLQANDDLCFQGANPDSLGFMLSDEERMDILSSSPAESPVIRRYIIGNDLTKRPLSDASRWIVDFSGVDEDAARSKFPRCFELVRERVKPGRMTLKRASYRERWWQFTEPQTRAHEAARSFSRVVGISRVTKYVAWQWIDPNCVIAAKIAFVASADAAVFGLLQSSVHECWAHRRGGKFGVGGSFSYAPTACFRSFPFPAWDEAARAGIREVATRVADLRATVMRSQSIGLTTLYNQFHDRDCNTSDIEDLRQRHEELDRVVALAYGWPDFDLRRQWIPVNAEADDGDDADEDEDEVRADWTYSIADEPREKVLARLLALNAERAQEEAAAALAATGGAKPKATAKGAKKPGKGQNKLFGDEDKS